MIRLASALVAAVVALASPADAQRGIAVEDFDTGVRARLDVGCLLKLHGEPVSDGTCTVAISPSRLVTIITVGSRKYRLERDEFDRTSAEFYALGGAGPRHLDTVTTTRGSKCWHGPVVRFCAH